MYICLMHSKELIKGTLQTIILNLLSEHGKMYGYEITQKVKLLTSDDIKLTEGALYPALHKLEAMGLVVTEKVNIGKRIRKYYYPTKAGKEAAAAKKNDFWQFVKNMEILLNPQVKLA